MGEAVYYYKAEFPEGALVSQLQEQLKAFHVEGAKAYEFWQENRDHGHKGQKDQETFWKEFATQFPVIYEYTQFLNIAGKGFDNELSGKMSWGSEGDAENLRFQGNTARYYAEVWHMASWEELGMFLKKKFGAIDFRWMSEEDGDVSFMLDQPTTDDVKEAADLIKTVMNSCVEGYTGEWGGTPGAYCNMADGFEAMYEQLQKAAKILGIDITGVKEI